MPIDRTSHLIAPVAGETVRRRSFCRSFLRFLFSNLGLVLLVIAYSVGGAFLFRLLEGYIELQNCQEGNLSEDISIKDISVTMYNQVLLSPGNTTAKYAQLVDIIENFTNDIYDRRTLYRYTGQDCETQSGWSIASAILFTITVITSIGYGHITPTSWEGQITCICYALIGIPIFLLCLANISSVLGDIFRFMYSALLHCFCCVCRVYTRNRRQGGRRIRAAKNRLSQDLDYTGTASVDPSWPEASYPAQGKSLENDYYDADDDEEDDIWDRMEGRVPFGAVILIIIGYICLGAFMFNRFENWTMIQSVYFCYVTLATIGFGDFVPGITSGDASGLRFVLASLYILFGLAILAMCFDLIKEGIVDKFHWFANKLGIIADDDDQIDEDRTRYANFEYDTSNQVKQPRENSGKRSVGKGKPNESLGEPPAYDSGSADGKSSKNIRDKPDSASSNERKKAMKIKDEKH